MGWLRISIFIVATCTGGEVLAQYRDTNEEQFAFHCRAPLKFAAGACVPACPAGFEDRGRVCVFRGRSGGGGA